MLNLFNSYLKRTSKTEITKNSFIILLVISAFYIIFQNVIAPLLGSKSSGTMPSNNILSEKLNDYSYAQKNISNNSIKSVDVSQLFWNENPKRDPFSIYILNNVVRSKKSNKTKKSSLSQTNIGVRPRLTAIIKGKDSNLAILDGIIMQVGESIRGFNLKSIKNKSVKIEKQSITMTINIDDREYNE